jgi:hypothetical protein
MAASMNSMMEQYVSRSIDIVSTVVPAGKNADPAEIVLKLAVTNQSRIPVRCSMTIRAETAKKKNPVAIDVEISKAPKESVLSEAKGDASTADNVIDESKQKMKDNRSKGKKLRTRTVAKSVQLNPGTLEWELVLEIKQMKQCNCVVELSFPSPGTGKMLKVEHAFGVYLIHRCKREWIKKHTEKIGLAVSVVLDCAFVRKFFRIPHSEGIAPGGALRLSVAGHSLMLAMKKVTGDDVELLVHMLGAAFPDE